MILSNLSVPLLAMVDAGVLGHLDSAHYLAGVALAGAVFSIVFIGLNFLRMGTTGIAAQYFGQDDGAGLRQSLWQAIIVATLLALVLIVLQHPLGSVSWYLLDADANVQQAAASYFHIRIWSAPATLINFALIGWFIGLQKTHVPLAIVITTNVVNIALDFLFVVGLDMTVDGVAIASVIAEASGAAVGLWFAARELRRWPQPLAHGALLQLSAYKQFFTINSNIFVRTMALVGTLAFVTAKGASFGQATLAANAILMSFQNLLAYGLDGLAHAAEALVGKAWGARDRSAVRQAVRVSLIWSVSVAGLFTLLFALFGEALIGRLTTLSGVRELAIVYLPWLIASPLISVFSFLYDGVFVGTTWAREMRNVMLASALLVFLPVWWLTRDWHNHGLWFAFIVFMAARGIGMAAVYRYRLNTPATRQWFANA